MKVVVPRKLQVLITESSVVWQSVLESSLKKENYLRILGVTGNTHDALDIASVQAPDILIIEHGIGDASVRHTIAALHNIVKNKAADHKLSVILLTTRGNEAVKATPRFEDQPEISVVEKSTKGQPAELIEYVKQHLLPEIRRVVAAQLHLSPEDLEDGPVDKEEPAEAAAGFSAPKPRTIRMIAIGVSTGGPPALGRILPILCEKTTLPILIVQHMPPNFSLSLTGNLKSVCNCAVKEASDNMPIVDGTIYIAPGDQHMLVRRTPQGMPFIALSSAPPEGGGFRPSVDVFFRSVASVYGNEAIAMVLTGMGDDGSRGVVTLKERGSYVIVQDEKSSVVWGMPKAVIDAGCFDVILPLDEIPHAVGNLLRQYKRSA